VKETTLTKPINFATKDTVDKLSR